MRNYWKQIAIILAQAFLFYLFPLMAKPLGAMGMVLFLVLAAFALALLMGCVSGGKIRFLYPVFAALLFIPSVFIYYNSSALVQAVWYLVIAAMGVSLGALVRHVSGR